MEARAKHTWIIVGLSVGALTLIGVGVFLWLRKKKSDETDSLPLDESPSEQAPTSNFSREEIKNMQAWLLAEGIKNENQVIVNAINKTGGIDGKIGPGFRTALSEAIRQGYIKSPEELYKISNK